MRFPALFFALFGLISFAPGADRIFDAFESDGFGEWKLEGTAFGKAPVSASPKSLNGTVKNYANDYYVTSSHGGDRETGSLTSPEFTISEPYIAFLISGGPHQGETAVQLLIDDEVVAESNGRSDLVMRTALWVVHEHQGKKARIRLLDQATGIWGIINADHFIFTDYPRPKFPLTTRNGTPLEEGLVPTHEIPGLSVPDGSEVTIFADYASHKLHSPTALTVDAHGRVYATETHRFRAGVEDNRDHLYWLHDDLAAQTTADRRALHEKWKERKPLADLTRNSEKIRVLVDSDGDGKADETKIFADGFNDVLDGTAAGIMALEGKIYFACIPNIYALEDENGDLVTDTKTILQDGFGVRVSFSGHDLNGFAQGPDGRIYCTIGDRGFSFTTKEGRTYHYPDQGAILRFDPDGSNFQVVHTGLRNPKEIAFDEYGTAITVDNNSDQGDRARVVFMMEGADSGWRMGHQVISTFHKTVDLEDKPINQWMAEKMWEPQNEAQPYFMVPPIANFTSGPSGLAYHPGTGYAKKALGQFLICDYRGNAPTSGIWHFGIENRGAGFGLANSGKFNWGVCATDLEWGYDGRVYVSDFIGNWVTHPAGRIYSLGHEGLTQDKDVLSTQKLIQENFSKKEALDLANLLRHPDQRIRLRAQLALATRKEALPLFAEAANQRLNRIEKLHGLWGLGIMARRFQDVNAMELLLNLTSDPDPLFRGQAVKALGDTHLPNSLPLLSLMLDRDPRVQALTALVFSKHPHPEVYDQLIPLIEENDDRDPYLRHATSLCLAANIQPHSIAELRAHASPSVRMAAVLALRRLYSPFLSHFIIDADPRIATEAIRAIHDLEIESARPAITALLDDYDRSGKITGRPLSPMTMRRLLYSAFRLGGAQNVSRLIKIAANPAIGKNERLEAIRLLAIWTTPPRVDQSLGKAMNVAPRETTVVMAALLKDIHHLFETDSLVLGRTLALASRYGLAVDTLDTGTLTRMVRDQNSDALTRSEALKLLMKTSPENPGEILTEAASSSQDLLANTALKLATEHDPNANVATLKAALESKHISRRQTAWKIIGTLEAEHAVPLIRDALEQLKRGKGDPESSLELLEAARSRSEPLIDYALTSYEVSVLDADPLGHWIPALSGGNPARGEKLYKSHPAAQCMRCHRANSGHSEGGEAGPNLMGVGVRHDSRSLLESLMHPSAKIAPGYGLAEVTLKNGDKRTGLILDDTAEYLDLKEGDQVWRIDKAHLASQARQTSSMPSMEVLLKTREARDIVAWLLTLTKDSGETSPAYETVALSLDSKPQPKPKKKAMSEQIDPAVMEAGKTAYMTCTGCHQAEGQGLMPMFPPLAGSEWVAGPAENLIRIQLHGLTGPITVKDQVYGTMPMAAQAHQSDETIAAVLTYVRNSWGNSASAVTPEMVKALRSEERDSPLTVDDLIDPASVVTKAVVDAGPLPALPSLDAKQTLGASGWGVGATLIISALCLVGLVRMKLAK